MNRDWRRAALDGLAVLSGILIAFGIDAWWERRGAGEESEASLRALAAEVEQNRQTLETGLELIAREQAELDRLFAEVVYAGSLPDSTLLRLLWVNLGPFDVVRLQDGALGDVLSSDVLSYLDNAEARRTLAVYQQMIPLYVEDQVEIRDHWNDVFVPYLGISLGIPDLFGFDLGVPAMKSGTRFDVDLDAFIGSRDFANHLAHRAFLLFTLEERNRALLGQVQEVRDRLTTES